MKNNKRIETEEQLLQVLEEFFCDVTEDEPIENIESELRDLGYDLAKLEKRGKEIVDLHIANSPLNWRNKAKKEIEIAKANLDKARIHEDKELDRKSLIDEIRAVLLSLGNKNSNFAPAHFRNFETASDNDLLSMLEQLKYLTSDQTNGEGE